MAVEQDVAPAGEAPPESQADQPGSAGQQTRQTFPLWSSQRAFILSTAAAAIGLGNLWRFPYLAGENGGAAFLVAYAVCMVVFAIPFAALEVAAGRGSRGGILATLSMFRPRYRAFGWAVLALTLLITSYYLVLTGWTFGYAVTSLQGSVESFSDFTTGYTSLWWFFATLALVTFVLSFGIGAIEAIGKFGTPVLVAVVAGIAVYGMTLGEPSQRAVDFLFGLDMAALGNPKVWFVALGQTFFSLAVGQGYLVTFGSHLPNDIPAGRSTAMVAMVNASVGILAGLMMFPFVFAAGRDPGQGSDMAFTVLPMAFEQAPAGQILAVAFFVTFFFAAFSSCLAGVKVLTAGVRDRIGNRHHASLAIAALALLVAGFPSAMSYTDAEWTLFGLPVLDAFDRVGGTSLVVLFGLAGGAILGWAMRPGLWADWLPGQSRATTYAMVWIARLGLPLAGLLGLLVMMA